MKIILQESLESVSARSRVPIQVPSGRLRIAQRSTVGFAPKITQVPTRRPNWAAQGGVQPSLRDLSSDGLRTDAEALGYCQPSLNDRNLTEFPKVDEAANGVLPKLELSRGLHAEERGSFLWTLPDCSRMEAFALGLVTAAATLGVGYGILCSAHLVQHWGLFAAGITRLVQ